MNCYFLEDNLIQQRRVQAIFPTCQVFENPTIFLDKVLADKQDKVIFLDLEIGNVVHAGLEIAKIIRQTDKISAIIILSTHTELVERSFKCHIYALDFIDKLQSEQLFRKQLVSVMDSAIANSEKSQKPAELVAIPNGRKHELVDINQIYAIYTDLSRSHSIVVLCQNKQLVLRSSLTLIEKLHADFLRVHSGYIINRHKIDRIAFNEMTLLLTNNRVIPFSRRYKKTLKLL